MTANNFKQLVNEDIRLTILQVLEGDVDYAHNARIIQAALSQLGHNVSTDKLAAELDWLAEQNLVTINAEPVLVAKLTNRGEDVALGRARITGVARPRPE